MAAFSANTSFKPSPLRGLDGGPLSFSHRRGRYAPRLNSCVRCLMKKIANPLRPGDVIQTNPKRGFWGCAVVLSARDSTDQFHPMCHIAITTLISKRKYAWDSVDPRTLEIVQIAPVVRVAPGEYYQSDEPRIGIGIYSLKSAAGLRIIGQVNPADIYSKPLTFHVGDGTKGKFPLCGPIPEDLGEEAVTAWRLIHDKERFDLESAKAMRQFERYEQQRLSEQRAKRQARGI